MLAVPLALTATVLAFNVDPVIKLMAAVTLAVSHAELARRASEVVLITDSNRPHRQAAQLGYELIGERAVLRFGPATGSIPRLPTGPLPRLRSR